MEKKTKKFIPVLLFILAFTGFLSTQILWDTFKLKADHGDADKQKYSVYETAFQGLNLTTTKGTVVDIKTEKTPIVVLNFWASWCLPCLKEFPNLVKFQEKYKGQVKVLGINGDEENPEKNAKKTEEKYKLNFESVLDPESKVSDKFLITAMPSTIVFHNGRTIFMSKKIHDFMDPEFLKLIDDSLGK